MNLLIFESRRSEYRIHRDTAPGRHLRDVLHVVPGDTLRVGILNGPRGEATVVRDAEGEIDLVVRWDDASGADKPIPLTVLLGHPRPPVLTRLWRDLSAMGVARIVVFPAVLTERSYLTSRVWNDTRRYLLEGLSQGMHTALPEVAVAADLADALVGTTVGHRLAAIPGATSLALPSALRVVSDDPGPVTVCIGPERGLVASELSQLAEAGFSPVGLGPRILRTETAAVLLAGAIAATIGEICSPYKIEL